MSARSEVNPSDTRERLLRAAADMFLTDGYGASMDGIAARAKVAKQTLYNHFTGKEALFGEVVRNATHGILVALDSNASDLRTSLIQFANAYRAATLSLAGIAIFRTLSAESQRFPALARALYAVGPGQTLRQLSMFLDQNMRAGRLRRDDSVLAAELLLGMLTTTERIRCLLGVADPLRELDQSKGAQIVDTFLRAYTPVH
ncbi:MAG: TetR/AcrR family transcriptional regulator [Sterolibacterium sp.]|jgi:TetR/AcrR family transcriptional repressor of mexJK operon